MIERLLLWGLVSALFLKSATAQSATSSAGITHTVSVAYAGFTYSPSVVQAEVGDIIEFLFYPTNHSVIRSLYGYPCVPYEDVAGVDSVGFFSGFKPVDTILADPPSWSVRVNDTAPIFYYCGAPDSCIGHQMVGVINPNATQTLAEQKILAANASFMLEPGEPWPAEAPSPTAAGTPSTSSSTPTSTSSTTIVPPATVTATPTPVPSQHSSLSGGAIAGIALGGAALVLIAGLCLWFINRHHKRNQKPVIDMSSMAGTGHGTPSMVHTDQYFPKWNSPSPAPQQQMYHQPLPTYAMGFMHGQPAPQSAMYPPQGFVPQQYAPPMAEEQRRFSMSPTPENGYRGPPGEVEGTGSPNPDQPRVFEIHSSVMADRSPRARDSSNYDQTRDSTTSGG